MTIYTQDIRYFEASFTLPNPRTGDKIKANFEREVLAIIDACSVDALVDARYGKGFDTVHFSIEFTHEDDFLLCRDKLEQYIKEHS